ncbi:formylglycine-generating enzyme family protein (plasmid) [Marinovum sp. KMM 9989]
MTVNDSTARPAQPDATHAKACCGVSRSDGAPVDRYLQAALDVPLAPKAIQAELRARLTAIPGGIFEMGVRRSTFPADLDSPRRKVKIDPFQISPTAVSTADYAAFTSATGYRTIAEVEGWSFVFHLLLDAPERWPEHPPGLLWWRRVDGASWAAPEGPGSTWQDRPDHPATHIAWYDALAYATWAGLRLPWEAEWERAARGGLVNKKFPWGNKMVPDDGYAMNTWQGDFPHSNSADDGYVGTAPVLSFRPNGYGLYNMTGNVWEWVADRFGPRAAPSRLPEKNPHGPDTGTGRVQRGGSFLCHVSYCDRYHAHSRTRNDPDSATSNSGFRVAG